MNKILRKCTSGVLLVNVCLFFDIFIISFRFNIDNKITLGEIQLFVDALTCPFWWQRAYLRTVVELE